MLVVDGDHGRDWLQPTRPLTEQAQKLIQKLQSMGVTVHVLKRYGVENYFSRSALEKTLKRDLSAFFPLDETRPIGEQIGGYDKDLNVDVIDEMEAADISGTDLDQILAELRKSVEGS
jgi:hypothetical protein